MGVLILVNFSMPFYTPAITIMAFIPINAVWSKMGFQVELTKSRKMAE